MRAIVITFLVAMALGTLFGPNELPSYPTKAGISEVDTARAPSGMKRSESIMPDARVIDGYRHVFYMTRVGDSDNSQSTDFPMQALQ